jgi:hypothetical protein
MWTRILFATLLIAHAVLSDAMTKPNIVVIGAGTSISFSAIGLNFCFATLNIHFQTWT